MKRKQAKLMGQLMNSIEPGEFLTAVVHATSRDEFRSGMFKDSVKIVGDILVDGTELGVVWDALTDVPFVSKRSDQTTID